jgi:hypothetical protein
MNARLAVFALALALVACKVDAPLSIDDASGDSPDALPDSTVTGDAAPDCTGSLLPAGCPCVGSSGCASGWCVSEPPLGLRCTTTCASVSDCAPEDACVMIGLEEVYLCVWRGVGACVPCAADRDCVGVANHCAAVGSTLHCLPECDPGTCPDGTECRADTEGRKLCFPVTDTCPCVPESCNGVDDDCDGKTDEEGAEGCTLFGFDDDDDGYARVLTVCLCGPMEGTTLTANVAGDCNDFDDHVYPGRVEDCATTADDNCDGAVNEGCPAT